MPAHAAAAARAEPFRLRAANFSILVLRLLDPRAEAVVPAIADQFRRAPGFLRHAPVALGLDDLDADATVDFPTLMRELNAATIRPIGTTGGSPSLRSAALAAGLPPLRAATGPAGVGEGLPPARDLAAAPPANAPLAPDPAPLAPRPPEPAAAVPPPAPQPSRRTMVVDTPVRAGQRVWAQGCDLVVTGVVNAGAEVIADGNIHVWGALRGRAIAGGADDTAARVFAMVFEPELVSIAGYYATRDTLGPDAPLGRPAAARLAGETMRFDRLG